jgi:pantoate--beta-alanine ligase
MNQGMQAITPVVLSGVKELQEWVDSERLLGHRIGFVPTMGALHEGHASLIRSAAQGCGRVVVSVFVNPTQFNDASDYSGYPLTPDADLALVEAAGGDAVFMPSVEEMYSGDLSVEPVDMGGLTLGWEAVQRPGHFDGVVAIVDRLFQAVRPDRAYFGEKDLQQLAVVRTMGAERHPHVEVVGCPLIRDVDGLALSSRNVRLSPAARDIAYALPTALHRLKARLAAGEGPMDALVAVRDELASVNGVELAYFDLVQRDTFAAWEPGAPGPFFAVLAATVGGVRLLDNLEVIS